MSFIRIIIEILLFYYIVKFLSRLFFPLIVKKVIEKTKQNIENQQNKQQNKNNYEQKGDVIYDNSKVKKSNKTNKKVGEYVDFEELE